jgi:hypothetical protein
MVADNIKAGLLTLFLGGFGDMLGRAIWLNCSVDKAWSMLFFLPPLSIVSAIMHFMNKIEKASLGCMSAFDWFMITIPIFTIMLAMIIPKLIANGSIASAISVITIFILYAIIRMYKVNEKCKIHFTDKYKGFKSSQAGRAFLESLIVVGLIQLFNFLAPYGGFIPVVGIGFRAWNALNMIPGLQTAIPLTFIHFITNMYENVPSKLDANCLGAT